MILPNIVIHACIHTYMHNNLLFMLPKKGFSARSIQYNYKYRLKFKLIKNISNEIINQGFCKTLS